MRKFSKYIICALILGFIGHNAQAQSSGTCFNDNAYQEERKIFTFDVIDAMEDKYPEINFGDLEFFIVPQAEMKTADNAGETRIEIQNMHEKRIWSDGREEILREWQEIRVPSITFNGEKEMPKSWIDYVWVHENAHVLYYRYLTQTQRDRWEAMFNRDKSTVTPYGASDPKENFAEWFTFFFYPSVFAAKECFTDIPLNMTSEKNRFMSEIRDQFSDRLSWLTPAKTFFDSMRRNAGREIAPAVSERLARDTYRRDNNIPLHASAPKEETNNTPSTTPSNSTRKVPDFVNQHIQKRKASIRETYLRNARSMSREEEVQSFLEFIKDRRENR